MDLQNFSISRSGTRTLTVPTWSVEGQLVDPSTGAVIRDFTGANAVSFPQILGQLTQAEQDEFVSMSIAWLLHKRFGI